MIVTGSYISPDEYKGIRENFDACKQSLHDFLSTYPFNQDAQPEIDAPLVEVLNYISLGWSELSEEERDKLADKIQTRVIMEYVMHNVFGKGEECMPT